MKKLNLLIIVAVLATALLAATPTKLVRLRVINDSGSDVYIKLEGDHTDSFYYLTIPEDEDMTFTIMSDVYARTTWACDGVKTTGKLIVTGNIKLRFVECNTIPLRWAAKDYDDDGVVDAIVRKVNQGEPTMEKVAYFKYYTGAYWAWNCGLWAIAKVTVKIPNGCYFRYRY